MKHHFREITGKGSNGSHTVTLPPGIVDEVDAAGETVFVRVSDGKIELCLLDDSFKED